MEGEENGLHQFSSEHLMELEMPLFVAGESGQVAFNGPIQLERLHD